MTRRGAQNKVWLPKIWRRVLDVHTKTTPFAGLKSTDRLHIGDHAPEHVIALQAIRGARHPRVQRGGAQPNAHLA
jgi:hypothetical protein